MRSKVTENRSGSSKSFPLYFLIRQLIPNKRIVGALFIIGWNIVWTSALMAFIKYVLRIPLRMTEDELLAGSEVIHGEVPYTFESCEAHSKLLAGGYIKKSDISPSELGTGAVILGQDPHPLKSNGTESQEIKID